MKNFLICLFSIIACLTMTSCPHDNCGDYEFANCSIYFCFEDEQGNNLSQKVAVRPGYEQTSYANPADYELRSELTTPSAQWKDEPFPQNEELKRWFALFPRITPLYLDHEGTGGTALHCSDTYQLAMMSRHVRSYFLVCPKIFGDNDEHELKTYWDAPDEKKYYSCTCYRLEYEGKEMKSCGQNRFVITIAPKDSARAHF